MAEKPSLRVGDILPGVLSSIGMDEKMEEAKLLKEWPEIVGEAVARRSAPRCIIKGQLYIEVENSAWMQEIRFHQGKILERIKERFPGLKLKGIRLGLQRKRDEE